MNKKQNSKDFLFEMMHKVAGMPKKLNEDEMTQDDIAAAAEDSGEEKYAESPMYQVKLDKISHCASEIHDKISDFENLPAWVQDKITIAEHNMCAIQDWLEGKAHDEKYQEDEGEEESEEIENNDEEEEESEDDVKISDDDLEELSESVNLRY